MKELKDLLKVASTNDDRSKILVKIEDKKLMAEDHIRTETKDVDFETKEYTVELIVKKYNEGLEDDSNELFIPDYQRDFVWDKKRQSRLIESLLLGFPIPYIFTADVSSNDPELDGRVEIVDGSQRIRTLNAFVNNDLILQDLKSLHSLNGFTFSDFVGSRQRRFLRIPVRVIELNHRCDEETRRDLFERINSGSDILKDMEVRKGSELGTKSLYTEVIKKCAELTKFQELAPLSEAKEKRDERLELVLRFFAYLDNYQSFSHSVRDFLNEYMSSYGDVDTKRQEQMIIEFNSVIDFVEKHIPLGFKKTTNANSTQRVRFESIAVGVALALRECPTLEPKHIDWLFSDEFKKLTTSDGSNSKNRVIERIEFVKNELLGN